MTQSGRAMITVEESHAVVDALMIRIRGHFKTREKRNDQSRQSRYSWMGDVIMMMSTHGSLFSLTVSSVVDVPALLVSLMLSGLSLTHRSDPSPSPPMLDHGVLRDPRRKNCRSPVATSVITRLRSRRTVAATSANHYSHH